MSQTDPQSERSFAQDCAYCGARFEVLVAMGYSEDQAHYACPECGKTYTAHGAKDPRVRVLAPRTDGKRDPYSETMF